MHSWSLAADPSKSFPPFFCSLRCPSTTPARRLSATCIAPRLMSHPIHRLPSFCAAAIVVPEPAKQSSTIESGLLLALTILSSNASGFWVGEFVCEADMTFSIDMSQTLGVDSPLLSDKYCLPLPCERYGPLPSLSSCINLFVTYSSLYSAYCLLKMVDFAS